MDNDEEQTAQARREVAKLRSHVHALRLVVLRLSAVLAISLVVVGSVMPAWFDRHEDVSQTLRVATVGFQAFSEPGDGFGVAAGIGFVGLLAVVLLLCGVLINSVVAGQGRSEHARVRGLIGTLALVGSVVATLFSLVAWGAAEPGVSGGAGPLVLLLGVTVGVVVMRHRPWHDLWID